MPSSTAPPREVRQELYDLFRTDVSFEDKARGALELGVEFLETDNGHLTRIDPVTDHWETLASTDSESGRFPVGLELDLRQTYCRRTIASDEPIALHAAPAQGWAGDPAFETHGLDCYHGTTLRIDEEIYGTVCFVAENQRQQFSENETMFAELITQVLERELECKHYETELTRQADLSAVLNRVLRHNLRNDMSVVRGYTRLMADELDEDSYSETALDTIDNLISLSQKARELDRVITAEFERESTDIVARIEDIVETVTARHPEAAITVEADEQFTATVFPSFERAVSELIENGAKHGGENPTVTVTVKPVPTAVEIQIADDGPGLADQEAEVLAAGTETPLTHGSGLGLWLAHWIVTRHDGDIEATVTDEGTTMTVTVPRQPTTDIQQHVTDLTRARNRYEAAFQQAFDAMLILDDDARIIDANPQAATVYGLDGLELLGRSIPEFLPADFDFDAAWEQFREAGTERDTVTVIGADGTERSVEYAATTNIVPGQHLLIVRDQSELSSERRT